MRQNLRELRGRMLNLLGPGIDDNLENTEIDYELNLAYKRICKEKGVLRTSYTASATAEQRQYALPTDLVELERVDFDEFTLPHIDMSEVIRFGDNVSIVTPEWTEDT